VLGIPYRQLGFVRALALLDFKGSLLAPPVAGARFVGEPADPGREQRFLSHVPLRSAIDAGTAIGSPYRSNGESRIAVALQIPGHRAVVAAEVSLGEIEQRMRQLAEDDVARVVDGRGQVVAGSAAKALSAAELDLVAAAAAGKPLSRVVAGANGTRWLASAAAVPQIGWTVLVAQPTEQAFRPAHHVRFHSALWAGVALLLIALLGVLLSRGLTGPMEKLSHAVAQLGDGRYDVELDIERGDEIGRFADAFRRMTADLRRHDDEIRRWNAELQARVD
jgi:HAMP domain-containing protein